jgi:hypothetical protein
MADAASDLVLDLDDGRLRVTGPDAVVDAVATVLAANKAALRAIVDVFGPVAIVAASAPATWPPKGGFVPAWRRLRSGHPLLILPTERLSVMPYAPEPPTVPCPTCTLAPRPPVPQGLTFGTGPWQTCLRCQGHRWRSTEHGDECATCGPMPGSELPPATWRRAGTGWVCTQCHPIPPVDAREVCAICGGKGRCRPDHPARLRAEARRLRTKARSAPQRARINAALAALAPDPSTPAAPPPASVPGAEGGGSWQREATRMQVAALDSARTPGASRQED